jgi:para-nitrobenzyl esterase
MSQRILRGLLRRVAFILACFAAVSEPLFATQPAAPRAHVESGDVIGVAAGGVASFKGVPYAAPPVAELRWRAPPKARPWGVARSAEDYGHSCAQPSPPERVTPASQAATTSEDCLTLNVWTPVQHPKKSLPVMVWIHGGGNNRGTSAQTYYDGSAFARDGIVLVSLNYRLGLFGFFAHPALTAQAGHGARANFGLLDQLAALQWVKRNIAAFGGDPRNVTVFGESSGGADIVLLMAARPAAGAFQKAIVESPGWWSHTPDLSQAQTAGISTATALGLPGAAATPAQLRAVPAASLTSLPDFGESGPVIDRQLLTEPAQTAFEHGRTLNVPLIIGTNNNEGSLLPPDARPADMVQELSESDYATLISFYRPHAGGDADHELAAARVDDRGSRAIGDADHSSREASAAGRGSLATDNADHDSAAAYDADHNSLAPNKAGLASLLFRDARFAMPSRWIAAHASTRAPVFLYRFDYVASFLSRRRTGANHGSEIPFVFATWPDFRLTPADRKVTQVLHGCWVGFAKTGIPTCADVPAWPVYSVESDVLMRFAAQAVPESVPDGPILDFLQSRLLAPAQP